MFEKFLEFNTNTITTLALLIIIGLGGLVFLKKSKEVKFTTRMIVYGSLCISLSFILSFIRLYKMPQGGTVTPGSMLPMIIYAMVFGPIPGIIAGFAQGILQYIQDPSIVHWAQVFIDYPLAFALLGLAGLQRKSLIKAILIGSLGRYSMHFISGIVFFGHYAPEGTPVAIYSLIYNATYLGPDIIICVAIGLMSQIQSLVKELQHKFSVAQ